MRRALLAAALLMVAPGARATAPAPASIAKLGPGAWTWNAAAPPGAITIDVDRRTQMASVYRGGALLGTAAVSTGKRGHGTPAGEFTILEKAVYHRSNLYSNAPMPYMQRLTWGGIAIHAGHNPGYPASHGCIRVPLAFARLLFKVTRVGEIVTIRDADAPGGWALVDTATRPPKASWLEQSQDDYVTWGGTWVR